MRVFSLTRTARYGIAVLSVVIAAALRLALDPILGEAPPYLLFFFPVILAAWYGGLGPGLLATALSLLLGDYLFIAPRYSILRYDVPQDLASLVLVVFVRDDGQYAGRQAAEKYQIRNGKRGALPSAHRNLSMRRGDRRP